MLENIAPPRVFHYFEKICSIPHGSGNTGAISSFCVDFAVKHGLEYKKEAINNVIIKKPASAGCENRPPVILQGHLDMVCEKAPDCSIDFSKDALSLELNGDLLSARGTTLGADDGIAVAMILAILEDTSLAHPPIEAIFTVDEEVGMDGAEALDTSYLSGKTLINLDSGEEGILTAGCAGGAKLDFKLPIGFEANELPCCRITLQGLLGGHSGVDINKGRQNADKLMLELLSSIDTEYRLVSINGGFKDNVIPNACECVIAGISDISHYIDSFISSHRSSDEPGLTVISAPAFSALRFDKESHNRAIRLINSIPSGVTAMSAEVEGAVQSSENLGILETGEAALKAVASVRSSVAADKQKMIAALEQAAEDAGAEIIVHGHYPAWEYRKSSHLRSTMISVYSKIFGAEPKVEAVHAGLECGLFNEKIPELDAISMGPDMWDIHTVNERLSISSTERTYKYLCEVLKEL